MICPRCNSNNTLSAAAICDQEIQNISGSGSTSGGESVYTRGTSKTQRAEALTADEPRRPLGGILLVLLIAVFCMVPCGGICLSSIIIVAATGPDPVTGAQVGDVGQVPLLFWSLLAFIVIAGLGIILSLRAGRRYRSRHQAWTLKFRSRYYCNNCTAIFQG